MKHDKEKLNLIFQQNGLHVLLMNSNAKAPCKIAMKQYAEQMVQQERERILKEANESFREIKNNSTGEQQWYDGLRCMYSAFINLINKEDE